LYLVTQAAVYTSGIAQSLVARVAEALQRIAPLRAAGTDCAPGLSRPGQAGFETRAVRVAAIKKAGPQSEMPQRRL